MGRGEQLYAIRLWGEVGLDPALGPLSKRARALLARLALAPGSGLARHAAAALLWPDRSDAQALANLRQLLHDHGWLSHGEAPLLLVSRDRLCLDRALLATDDDALIAAAAEPMSLADAVARTEPLFLGGLDDVGDEFDAWRATEQRRATERLAAATREAAARALSTGDTVAAARLADAWARFDGCDEVMACLGLAADADAASVQRRMAALTAALAADLGVEPSTETRRSVAAALARVNRAPVPAAGAVATPGEAGPPVVAPVPATWHRVRTFAVAAVAAVLLAGGGWWAVHQARIDAAPAASDETLRAEALTMAARQLVAARNRNAYAKAAEQSRAAIVADPGYAPAWTELAIAIWLPAWWAEQNEPGARVRIRTEALAHLDRALALSPGLPRALAAKGLILKGTPEGGRLLERAASADPTDADVWLWTSAARLDRHDLRGALAALSRAVELAPTRARIVNAYAALARSLGRNDLADAAIERFSVAGTDKVSVQQMRADAMFENGRLGEAASMQPRLLEDGPADSRRAILALVWAARATGDLAAVRSLASSYRELRTSYAAIYDPDRVEARLMERPNAFLDNVMADAESRSLLKLGKGSLLLDLAARHPARFDGDPTGSCCHDLSANLILAMREAGRTEVAATLRVRVERDTASLAEAGIDDRWLPLQRMVLSCLSGDAAAAGDWLNRAIDKGWRGQDIYFAADPADEPACAAAVKQPEFAAARARLLKLAAAERPAVAAATGRAIAYLQKNPPVTPAADAH